jgi:hypothetical protein
MSQQTPQPIGDKDFFKNLKNRAPQPTPGK